MLIYDVLNKEKVHQIISNDLRNFGVKRRVKKPTSNKPDHQASNQSLKRVFKTPLSHLPLDVVKLSSGAIVHVPNFVSQACSFVERCITHEGIFRKAGSHLRQKEIIARLDSGGSLGDKHQVIDVANVLKTFFRDLPESLIPISYHDVFLRCALLKNSKTEAILMACLLLPPHHINTLAFFAEFLQRVAKHEKTNKMGVDNLAKVVGPNIMPLQETTMSAFQSRLETHLVIVKILIENAEHIGVLPDHVADEVMAAESIGSVDTEANSSPRSKTKKKKRRSGSLTRMFNGLKKMVSKSGSPDETPAIVSSDFNHAHTPSIKTGKKRKVLEPSAPLSAKKKREVLQTLPDGGLPTRQGNFMASIVSNDPNLEIFSPCKEKSPTQKSRVKKYLAIPASEKAKKTRLSLDRLVSKSKQKLSEEKTSSPPKIERRWSSVSNSSWKSKKRVDSKETLVERLEQDQEVFMEADVNLSDFVAQVKDERPKTEDQGDEEYVTIPKSEYEEIKNRVSAIESRISQEFGCISSNQENLAPTSASKVQSEYEKTLEEASIGSTATADHLAKRLGKELKIRRSAEHKIIRSPSARKIGNLRRRSQEKPTRRHVSWQATSESFQKTSSLKRGRPNTVCTGLTQPSSSSDPICSDETNARLDFLQKQLHALINHTVEHTKSLSEDEAGDEEMEGDKSPRPGVRRASSFHGSEFVENSKHFNARMKELKKSNVEDEAWKDAERYFRSDFRTHTPAQQTGRASVAKLRTQNAGMVLAKAKLFDVDSEGSRKPTARRKHSKSPKNVKVLHSSPLIKMELTIMPQQKIEERRRVENEGGTTPHIKRPLTLKTPKESRGIIRKHGAEARRTPMKAVAMNAAQLSTPRRQSPRSALKTRQLTRSVS